MQASPSTERAAGAAATLSPEEQHVLLTLARAAIAAVLHGEPPPALPQIPRLLLEGACFVTLKERGELRGCIGTLTAHRPLAEDVRHNARNAAFRDPRFPPLSAAEFPGIGISISVLTPPRPFAVTDEAQLLHELRSGEDGLILEDGGHRATFLPAVWEQLPAPATFLAHLKRKAGLPVNHWSPTLRFSRYRSIEFSEAGAAPA